jgi:carbamoyl-phosphate synthase large subunit
MADEASISPRADAPVFSNWLISTCRQRRVAAVLSGAEPVLNELAHSKAEFESATGARLLVSPPSVLAVGNDKQKTCEWLSENGFDAPDSVSAADKPALKRLIERHGYALFAKPRAGKGSSGLHEINGPSDLAQLEGRADYVIQERVGTADAEFTAATLSDRNGAVAGAVVMRRRLQHGTSVFTEFVDHPQLRQTAIRIAERLRPIGPCNMQFRLCEDRCVCFELNIRFSGTAPIRAHFGFNDVDVALQHFVADKPMPSLPNIVTGRCMRYWNEVYPAHGIDFIN